MTKTKGGNKQVMQSAKAAAPKGNSEVITGKDAGTVAAVLGDAQVAAVVVIAPAAAAPSSDVPSTAGAETITTVTGKSKSQMAQAIFRECYAQSPVPQRKDIIARAMAETGLTQAGAATYLQNFKSANGLTKKVAPAAAAPAA